MKSIFLMMAVVVGMAGCCSLTDKNSAYHTANIPQSIKDKITAHQKLSVDDVVVLSKAGARSSLLITYLSYSKSAYNITPQEKQQLLSEGVSGDVVAFMEEKPDDTGGMFSLFDVH